MPLSTQQVKAAAAGAGVTAAAMLGALGLIMPWEGMKTRAYLDIVGVPTICYGKTRGVKLGQVATPAECQTELGIDVVTHARAIQPCLKRPVPDKAMSAFISLSYNIGPDAFCRSSVALLVNLNRLPEACKRISLFNRSGGRVPKGLVNRRAAERALCEEAL